MTRHAASLCPSPDARTDRNKAFLSVFSARAALLGLVLLAGLLLSPAAANAYWIRPFTSVGGSVIDGLDVDGATYDQQGFSDAAREVFAEVDLLNGSLGTLSRIGQPGVPVYGAAPTANALFGDTVTFNTDMLWEPELTIDGFLETGSPGAPSSVFYVLSLTIFAGHTSGGPDDWFPNRNQALIDDEVMMSFDDMSDLSEPIGDSVGGAISVTAGQSFDIVARLIVACGIGTPGASTPFDPAYCLFDASNTAILDMAADASTFTSTSGLLGSEVTVPEPSSLGLLALAAAAVAARRRQLAMAE